MLRHDAATHAGNTASSEVAAVSGIISRLVIADSLVAARQTNSFWMLLFNFLRNQANFGLRVALEVVAVDVLAIEGLTNKLDVLLQALVRKAAKGLTGICGRAR